MKTLKHFSILLFVFVLPLFMSNCEKDDIPISTIEGGLKSEIISQTEEALFWGIDQFIREKGKPKMIRLEIGSSDIKHFEDCFTLKVRNGDGKSTRVSSAIIKIDGETLFDPSDFSKPIFFLDKEVSGLSEESVIEVEVRGKPGSWIEVWIEGMLLPGRAIIGDSGGEVLSDDGLVSIVIPPGVVEQPMIISAVTATNDIPQVVDADYIGDAYILEPSGVRFSQPITVIMKYFPENYDDINKIGVLHWSEEYSSYNVIAPNNDIQSNELEFTLDHFSALVKISPQNTWTVRKFYWDTPIIKWYIDPDVWSYNESWLTPDNISMALSYWEHETSSFTFEPTGEKSEANIRFYEVGRFKSLEYLFCNFDQIFNEAKLGMTCPDFATSTFIRKLDSENRINIAIASYEFSDLNFAMHTIVHEIGHALGLDHPVWKFRDNPPIMQQGNYAITELHEWDIEALHYYYDPAIEDPGGDPEYDTFTDPRDGEVYKTVPIGNQVWMAENLRAKTYPDGTQIPLLEGDDDWASLAYTDDAYCWYDNEISTRDEYGALYTWAAAMNGAASSDLNPSGVQGVCPHGWHLPSDSEWKELEMYLGMSQPEADDVGGRGADEGGKLKETGTTHWRSPNAGATNESGFTALPGGFRHDDGSFYGLGDFAIIWSATENSPGYAWRRFLSNNFAWVDRWTNYVGRGNSIRCIKD